MPLSQDYTYQLGENGVVLNVDETTSTFVDITKISGLDSAPPRSTERDHEGTDGGFMDAEYEKGRPVALEGTVYAVDSDIEPYLDELKLNWALSRTPVPLYFKKPGVTERVLFVKPLGCRYDFEPMLRLGQADIQFQAYAEDPRVYSATLSSVNIYQGEQIITGRGYPRGYPYGYGVSALVVGTVLNVDGNRPTPPVFIMNGPVRKPQILNETTGEQMVFDIDLGVGDSLVVDIKNRTVTLNGQNRRAALREPHWFFLQPGTNYIRYRAESFNLSDGPTINSNSNFDTDIAPWTGVSGGAISLDVTKWHLAGQSLQLVGDGASASPEARAELVPIEVGTTYKADVWVNCTVTRNVVVGIRWYDSTSTLLSTTSLSGGSGLSVTANTWTNLTVTGIAPTNSAFARLVVFMTSTPANTILLNIDEARLYGQFPSILNAQFRAAWR